MFVNLPRPSAQLDIEAAARERLREVFAGIEPLPPVDRRMPWQRLRCMGDKPERPRRDR